MSQHAFARLLTGASALLMIAAAGAAGAAEAGAVAAPSADQAEAADFGNRVQELVITATNRALAAAPAKASVAATQPQTIITRDAIDQFIPATADYTQIVNLSPSLSGTSFNGPGLGEAKTTLRGFQDGSYNITYDGIPWGDANGPTHHSTSFFPSSTIGAVVVDRGPGRAGDIGIASFGGSINLYSPEVANTFGGSQQLTAGSFSTFQSVTKINTGEIAQLNGAKALFNFQELITDGNLTFNKAQENNQMFRIQAPLAGSWKLTLFGAYNFIKINTNDNAGATLSQVAMYGKDYSLNNNPATPNYYGYNVVTKNTYFDYARLTGDLARGLTFETQPYVYYYKNDTESSTDVTLTPADLAAKKGLQWFPTPGSKAIVNGDIPGYIKLNKYQIYGDVTRLDWTLPFGNLRPGVWVEHADTHRMRYDYNATRGRNVPDYRQAVLGSAPQNEEYDQNSGWDQYQPFIDFEWRPTDKLTITPGVKYVNYTIRVDTLANQKTRTPLNASHTFRKDLEYLTVNYRIRSNWSVYGQYATGILVPDISAFQVSGPNLANLNPQTSTNYQLGTVFHGGRVSVDADIYKIDFKNKIGTLVDPATRETVYFNQGGVTYQGVEAQVSYALNNSVSVFANGSINDAKDNVTHLQVGKAPKGTAGLGALFKAGNVTASIIDKYTGEQWAADGQPTAYHIQGYHSVDLSMAVTYGRYKLQASVYNLTDSQQFTAISPGKTVPYDQYYFQAPRNFSASVKVAF